MHTYSIKLQLANVKANVALKDFEGEIHRAAEYYNMVSLAARNPKKILSAEVVDDRTIEVNLQSEAELPCPSKGLRIFTQYLADLEAFNPLVTRNTLFKSCATELYCIHEPDKSSEPCNRDESLDTLRVRAIGLVLKSDEKTLKEIIDTFSAARS